MCFHYHHRLQCSLSLASIGQTDRLSVCQSLGYFDRLFIENFEEVRVAQLTDISSHQLKTQFNSFPHDKILGQSKLKAFADKKIHVDFLRGRRGNGRKHCLSKRKCWLPAFSPFYTMFSKGFSYRVVKSQN